MKRRLSVSLLSLLCALAAITVVTSPARATDPPPTVSIAQNQPIYTYGQSVGLSITVGNTGSGKYLEVDIDGAKHPLIPRSSTTNDVHTASVGAYINFTVHAYVYDSDATTLLAEAVRTIKVRAVIETAPFGFHQKSGSYSLYPKGASPRFRSVSGPAAPGQRCLTHVVQRRYAAGWRNVFTSACRVEAKQGRVDWTWRGKHASKVKFRARCVFAGDSANAYNVGQWQYFKFK